VAPRGKFIAFVSAEVETDVPEAELEPGLALLGVVDERIIDIYDMYEPANDSSLDNCFISKVFFLPFTCQQRAVCLGLQS
jgi:Rab GDP dissociation inhibitor